MANGADIYCRFPRTVDPALRRDDELFLNVRSHHQSRHRRPAIIAPLLLIFCLVAIMLGSCGWNSDSGSDTLDVGLWQSPASFDPHRAKSDSEIMIANLLYPGLVGFDSSGQVMPALAESWDISPDGLTYIFRLGDKKWSDGETLNADDVVQTFRRLFEAKSLPPAAAQMFDAIENAQSILQRKSSARTLSVRALADNIIEIKLSHPEPSMLQRLASPQAAVVPLHAQRRLGSNLFKPGHMVTSGNFRLETGKDQQIVLNRQEKPGARPLPNQ